MVVFFIGMGLVFLGLGWPLYRGKVKPNHWYGLRVGETMEDERVWYAGNAYSGRDFVVLGAMVSAVASRRIARSLSPAASPSASLA